MQLSPAHFGILWFQECELACALCVTVAADARPEAVVGADSSALLIQVDTQLNVDIIQFWDCSVLVWVIGSLSSRCHRRQPCR